MTLNGFRFREAADFFLTVESPRPGRYRYPVCHSLFRELALSAHRIWIMEIRGEESAPRSGASDPSPPPTGGRGSPR